MMKLLTKLQQLFFLFLLVSFSFAQTNYEQEWKKIAENTKTGIYKSNLPIVMKIQEKAIEEQNIIEIIKSLKAEYEIINRTRDDDQNNTISTFYAKVSKISESLTGENRLVYHVFASRMISDYFSVNSWKIGKITNLDNADLNKIETWSKLDFKNYLSGKYSEFSENKNQLRNIPLNKYKSLFVVTKDTEYFPSIYDWVSINKIQFLSDANLFTKNELAENRKSILAIYDELIAYNTGNSRLFFSHQKMNFESNNQLIKDELSQLENLINDAQQGDYKVLIIEDVILKYQQKGEIPKALSWIEKAYEQYPKSKFLNNIKNRENLIKSSTLSIKLESVAQSGKPILLFADHKNLDNFSLNIYKASDLENFLRYLDYSYEANAFSKVLKKLVKKENYQLQNLKDYKNYKTALEIQPLPTGIYIAEQLVDGKVQRKFHFFVNSSRLIYQNKDRVSEDKDLMKLIDVEDSKPLGNEKIISISKTNQGKYKRTQISTDAEGIFTLPKSERSYYSENIVYLPKTGEYISFANHYSYRSGTDSRYKATAQIFLDRGIYRPGQTVYFKVINTKFADEKEAVIEKLNQKITLIDASREEVSSQSFITNEFGSYHGNFILPKNLLNGNFQLRIDNYTSKNFKVEEYKRPKFEVTFEKIEDEYKYGQTIEVKGKAMMFSGVPLSEVNVNIEIKKQNIRWRYFWWLPREQDNENSILETVKTNEKGEFVLRLNLEKNPNLKGIQVDNYQLRAAVTDINGETQFATSNVKVASASHYIAMNEIPGQFADQEVKIKVETKNYNDQNLKKSYQTKLVKLQEPNKIFRENFQNEIQSLPNLSKEEFSAKFPYDRYDKLDQNKNWKVEALVFNKTQNEQELNLGLLKPGYYRLETYNIEEKDTIRVERDFQVWDKTKLNSEQKSFLKVIKSKDQYARGEVAKLYIYSSVPNALVHVYSQDGSGVTKTEVKTIDGILEYDVLIPMDKKIGNIKLEFLLAAYNDLQSQTLDLAIKNDAKKILLQTSSFRDKLQPGVLEKWSVKVIGEGQEQVSAEVLANMYDKSLDQFASNTYTWQQLFYTLNNFKEHTQRLKGGLFSEYYNKSEPYLNEKRIQIPYFSWFGGYYDYTNSVIEKTLAGNAPGVRIRGAAMAKDKNSEQIDMSFGAGEVTENDETLTQEIETISVRQNLNETAFFYPNLLTDKEGNVAFEFTSPEALTQWKFMLLAHTKDAKASVLEKIVVTQKDFSVTPNYPRFLREGDEVNLQAKLSNLSSKKLKGNAYLQILDAYTEQDVSALFNIKKTKQSFDLKENASTVSSWSIKVPNGYSSVVIKVVAKAGDFSDGEQKALAILPNRMLVTDALPIFVKEGETKTFVLEELKNTKSNTIENFSNTLELTTNPVWELIFALPSLAYDTHNSADVVFNKWFADVLASEIFRANPKMKSIFEQYQDKGLIVSNLEKNQELKQLLLEETPWVLDAKSEKEQMQNIARLFDVNAMRSALKSDWKELLKLQNSDGGFSWHKGYPSNYYISLYILKNLGRISEWLKEDVKIYQTQEHDRMVASLVRFVDKEMNKYWKENKENPWTNASLDYLDSRRYWEAKFPLKGNGAKLKEMVIAKAKTAKIQEFTFYGLHRSALLLDQYGLKEVSKKLMIYLKETSTETKTQGIYWKKNLNDWGWFSSKVVNQAGAIDAFGKLMPNDPIVEKMKIWLITQKEVNAWGNSRNTAEVIFTFLNSGKSWTTEEANKATVIWGGTELKNTDVQATGYLKETVKTRKLDKNLASVTVTKPGAGIVQGGLFWQYYEDLDKINSSETYISITKELYRKVKTANGEVLKKISAKDPILVGDKVTVRMILNTDRPMEFIHLKDMRAAGFEPIDVLSGYQWKNNLGYYQVTKDASTNFYIEYMPKGKYVFEYDYVANISGYFSSGIATLQNYYAPQMNAHTKGDRVKIEAK